MKTQFNRIVVLAFVFLAGCVGGNLVEDATVAHGGLSQVTTSASTYASGQSASVSWTNMPTNPNDWIAVAPEGADPTTVTAWVYTNGASAGTQAFAGLPDGSYVARGLLDDSYTILAESLPFTVGGGTGSAITTDLASYSVSQDITATWTNLPGNTNDWVALAPAGSPLTSVIAYVYTNGAANGMTTFSGLATAGDYVARAFSDDSYQLLAESAFTVTGGSFGNVSTDKANYSFNDDVIVTWSNLPGNMTDWVAISPQGSSATTVTRWVYTNGQASGSFAFEAPATGGAYVARAYINDSYNIIGESTPFVVGLTVSTDKSAYTTSEPVTVSWENLPGNNFDWIAIAPAGSPVTTVLTWVYTNGVATGQNTFAPLAGGTYVARAFLDNGYTLLDESASFTVSAGGGMVTVSTDLATYAAGQDITVTWAGLPGNANDWIALAPDQSSDTTVTLWVYTGGQAAGSTVFVGGLGAAGTYVARAFENDTYNKLGESSTFDVQ